MSLTSILNDWELAYIPLIILASFVAMLFNIIFIMLGKSFSISSLERFGKSELSQTIVTIFMAGFLVAMIGTAMVLVSNLIAGSVVCEGETYAVVGVDSFDLGDALRTTSKLGGPNTPLEPIYSLLLCRLSSKSSALAQIIDSRLNSPSIISAFLLLNSRLSVLGIPVYNGATGFFLTGFGNIYELVEQARLEMIFSIPLLIALNSQFVLLTYIYNNMLTVFLPLGILLRAFYITRPVGGLFISLAISLFFIFPVVYFVLDPGFVPAPPKPLVDEVVSTQSVSCVNTMQGVSTLLTSYSASPSGVGGQIAEIRSSVSDIARTYLELIIHPLVSLSISLMIGRYIMSLLGADPYAISRMVGKVI